MTEIENTKKSKKKLSTFEKVFTLFIVFGSFFLCYDGYTNYIEIMNNPKMVRGVISQKKLSTSSSSNYAWDFTYIYTIDKVNYRSSLRDNSPLTVDLAIGDSLYVYYQDLDPSKSLGFNRMIDVSLRPNFKDFLFRDSKTGFLSILVLIVIAMNIIPLIVDLLYVLLVGSLLIIINKKKSKKLFANGYSRLERKTIIRLSEYFERW